MIMQQIKKLRVIRKKPVTATTAPYCVWFAGFDKNSEGPSYHYRDLATDPKKFMTIPTLSRYGETQDTIGKYRKQDLKLAKALKLLFSRMYYKLYGNGPIKREENIAIEVIKLLFCKIIDELSPDELCQFRATPVELTSDEGRKAIRKRIDELYGKLLKDPDFGTMFKGEIGQFFTPREIVRFAMDVIEPSYKNNELILDTAYRRWKE